MTDRASWFLAIPTLALLGCGGGEATATERLWISTVPTSPKEPITAFITTRTSDGKYLGAFFKGSLYRGGHDVFEWYDDGKDAAHLEFLQDGTKAKLRIEKCTPTTGFDHCMLLHGDPTGTVRYQSRKRWVVRRPGKKSELDGMVTQAIVDLAGEDEDLRALTEL